MKITKTGLYKTRDGRQAYVSFISSKDNDLQPVMGIIEGMEECWFWQRNGITFLDDQEQNSDIVSEWEE